MSLSHEDGEIVGRVALDVVAEAGEHYGDDVRLRCVIVTLVLEDDRGIHTRTLAEERH